VKFYVFTFIIFGNVKISDPAPRSLFLVTTDLCLKEMSISANGVSKNRICRLCALGIGSWDTYAEVDG